MLSSFDVASLLLPALVSAAVLACGVALALACLHCRDNGPPVSIPDARYTSMYIPSSQFTLVHPHQSTHLTPGPPSPFIPALGGGSQRSGRSDRELSESESNHSYQNSHNEQESLGPDYIIVLPGDEPPAANLSGASTPSSGELHSYENVQSHPGYLNVTALPPEGETPTLSSQRDEDDDDSDDGEEKYVNQPSVMSSSPLHDGM
ncbi:uncharacterized protein [Syngnathus scovelli]|uniref:uncharacterized protein n=1 Tax=Syngnathus scovelli TaxID=161590 RepID=UPI0021106127|nr:uncharacterized protein LOC125983285 [Syngnathus scovelli]XP_049600372.1 uncharacterized protein LOC125983285 [Syngnathus scovelli]XP_049600374.1 uncharacterized protein LOC125983285 [Syngnathus scovelli]